MRDEQKTDLQNELENLAAESLLIELFNKKQAEVFENIVFEGKKRFYIEDLTQRDYFLENTTPYQLKILNLVFNLMNDEWKKNLDFHPRKYLN